MKNKKYTFDKYISDEIDNLISIGFINIGSIFESETVWKILNKKYGKKFEVKLVIKEIDSEVPKKANSD